MAYVALLFGLFVVPRVLQRFGIPSAITSILLGVAAGPGLGILQHDPTVAWLSTLGIVSVFLFAGLDVDVADLKRERAVLAEHLIIRGAILALGALVAALALQLELRPAVMLSLALLTPSTGFILDSLAGWGLSERTAFWVRSKAIATEVLALGVMFVTLQSATARQLLVASAILAGLVLLLPVAFRAFAHFIVPHAPKTEFAFLMMVAVLCALVTRQLGVYYLVGAFIVGIVAQRFRRELPAMASERMLHAVESFASIFVPFYFFHAGLALRRDDLTLMALLYGLAFLALALPVRVLLVAIHRRIRFAEPVRESLRVAVPMLPTLVFTLVIAEIIRDKFPVPIGVYGGLVVYALVNTMIPSLVFRAPPPEFGSPAVLPLPSEIAPEIGRAHV